MIDTSKYDGHTEGHKEGSWDIYEVYDSDNKLMKCIRPLHDKWGVDLPLVASKDAQLIADAPLFLAEVKRLREMMDVLASFHIVKNVEQGFTQREWVELVELVKRGEEE